MGYQPQVHFISSPDGDRYCLDVASSALFAVDQIAFDALSLINGDPINDVAARLAAKYTAEEVNEVLEAIHHLQKNGYLTHFNPMGVRSSPLSLLPDLLGISLFVSNTCGLACSYCFNDGGAAGSGGAERMTPETAEKAVDFLLSNSTGAVGIDFFGGEPLMNWGLIKHVVHYCESKDRAFQYSLITNGTILTEEMLEVFAGYNFHIVVSYDGYLQNVQRPSRRGMDLRETIRKNIRSLVSRLPQKDISIRPILTHQMLDLVELAREADELGVRMVPGIVTMPQGNPLNLTGDDFNHVRACESEYLISCLREGKLHSLMGTTNITNTILRAMKKTRKDYSCGVGMDILGIAADGDIYPCHRFIGLSELAMGNVSDGLDMNAFARYANLFVDARNECSRCWARYFCGGGCAHESYVCTGDVGNCVESRCDLIRYETELGLMLYAMAADKYPYHLQHLKEMFEEGVSSNQ